ncbi:hypothetical protein [Nitratiruptor sp. YY08-13]|nr:hypothetical protein [Nitratiruptor sp. YY08-13]
MSQKGHVWIIGKDANYNTIDKVIIYDEDLQKIKTFYNLQSESLELEAGTYIVHLLDIYGGEFKIYSSAVKGYEKFEDIQDISDGEKIAFSRDPMSSYYKLTMSQKGHVWIIGKDANYNTIDKVIVYDEDLRKIKTFYNLQSESLELEAGTYIVHLLDTYGGEFDIFVELLSSSSSNSISSSSMESHNENIQKELCEESGGKWLDTVCIQQSRSSIISSSSSRNSQEQLYCETHGGIWIDGTCLVSYNGDSSSSSSQYSHNSSVSSLTFHSSSDESFSSSSFHDEMDMCERRGGIWTDGVCLESSSSLSSSSNSSKGYEYVKGIVRELRGHAYDIKGYYIYYGDVENYDPFKWIYISRSKSLIAKLEGLAEDGVHLKWIYLKSRHNNIHYIQADIQDDKVLFTMPSSSSMSSQIQSSSKGYEYVKGIVRELRGHAYDIKGYYIYYGDVENYDPFKWIYISRSKSLIAKLEGLAEDGVHLKWIYLKSRHNNIHYIQADIQDDKVLFTTPSSSSVSSQIQSSQQSSSQNFSSIDNSSNYSDFSSDSSFSFSSSESSSFSSSIENISLGDFNNISIDEVGPIKSRSSSCINGVCRNILGSGSILGFKLKNDSVRTIRIKEFKLYVIDNYRRILIANKANIDKTLVPFESYSLSYSLIQSISYSYFIAKYIFEDVSTGRYISISLKWDGMHNAESSLEWVR